MAQKYLKDDDAEELKRLSEAHGVRESEILTALIWQYGEQGAEKAAAAKKAADIALKGAPAAEGLLVEAKV